MTPLAKGPHDPSRSPQAERTATVRLPAVHPSVTPGGLKILIAQRGPLPLASIHLVLRAGSSSDPRGKRGLADFVAGLLRRGTRRRSADEINEEIEFYGARLSCGVDEDTLSLRVTTPSEHLGTMLQIVSELVREPSFPTSEVDAARDRLLAQLANDLDDPALLADRALLRALWGDHPYGHDVVGTARDASSFVRRDAVEFHRSRFGPKVALMIIVGWVDPAQARRLAERTFAAWSGGPRDPPQIPAAEAPAVTGLLLVDKPEQTQSQLRMGGKGFPKAHPDLFPATVMNTALGGGFTSRLVQEIRVKRGLSYGVSSGFERLMAGGAFTVSTFTKTESTRQILEVALREVRKMRQYGPTAEEVKAAKTYLGGLYPMRFETNESVAAAIAEIRVYGLGDDWVQRFVPRIAAVTRPMAAQIARKYLFDRIPALVVVGNAAVVRKQLAGLGTPRVLKAAELG
jgi:zinc protease